MRTDLPFDTDTPLDSSLVGGELERAEELVGDLWVTDWTRADARRELLRQFPHMPPMQATELLGCYEWDDRPKDENQKELL